MKTYHIITIGCQMNKSDSERLAGVLEKNGYKFSDDKYRSDLVVVNTCGVRQSAEDRAYGVIPRIKKENPFVKIILTGCLVKREDVKRRLKKSVDEWLPINKIFNQFLKTNFKLNKKSLNHDDYLKIKPKHQSKFFAYIPIGNGCNNFCSYCVVPYARGREAYRPAKEIITEVNKLVDGGYKEIILIAQNVNSYYSESAAIDEKNKKKDRIKQINFSDLLRLVNDIPGDFKIKFATSHPKDMTDELIKTVAECPKVCKEIHLPVQSGDNGILKKMNRRYTVEHYKKLIKKIKQAMPEVRLTTDVIVGFPGETKRQFNNTAKLFKEIKFNNAYIARYSPRPGTAAAKLSDNVPTEEKIRRWQTLDSLFKRNKTI